MAKKTEQTPEHACREGALRLLERRAHTVSELRRKLRQREHDGNLIETVLEDFVRVGLVNDRQFAEAFCEERKARDIGARRMFADLRKRGIAAELAKNVMDEVWDDDGSEERARAQAAAERKWRSIRDRVEDRQKARGKLARFLAGRGFPAEICFDVIDNLIADD